MISCSSTPTPKEKKFGVKVCRERNCEDLQRNPEFPDSPQHCEISGGMPGAMPCCPKEMDAELFIRCINGKLNNSPYDAQRPGPKNCPETCPYKLKKERKCALTGNDLKSQGICPCNVLGNPEQESQIDTLKCVIRAGFANNTCWYGICPDGRERCTVEDEICPVIRLPRMQDGCPLWRIPAKLLPARQATLEEFKADIGPCKTCTIECPDDNDGCKEFQAFVEKEYSKPAPSPKQTGKTTGKRQAACNDSAIEVKLQKKVDYSDEEEIARVFAATRATHPDWHWELWLIEPHSASHPKAGTDSEWLWEVFQTEVSAEGYLKVMLRVQGAGTKRKWEIRERKETDPRLTGYCVMCGHHKGRKTFAETCPRKDELLFNGGTKSAMQLMIETSHNNCNHWIPKPEKPVPVKKKKEPVPNDPLARFLNEHFDQITSGKNVPIVPGIQTLYGYKESVVGHALKLVLELDGTEPIRYWAVSPSGKLRELKEKPVQKRHSFQYNHGWKFGLLWYEIGNKKPKRESETP